MRIENFKKLNIGFTLVELMIVVAILGIMAAIVLPEFQNHAQQAKEAAAKDNLRVLRDIIERYAIDHNNVAPGYPYADPAQRPNSMQLKKQLIQGGYILKFPANPINNSTSVHIVLDGEAFPDVPFAIDGWIFKPQTKEFRLNSPGVDSTGIAYFSY